VNSPVPLRLPKFIFGLSGDLSWKQFDLSFIFSGAAGHQLQFVNVNGFNGSSVVWGNHVSADVAADRYFFNDADPNDPKNNINGKYTRLKVADGQNTVASDWWLYDATWVKLRNLQLGYNLPASFAKKALIQRARVFFSGENLFMITPFPGLDPEMGTGFTYPTMKQYAVGLNVTF